MDDARAKCNLYICFPGNKAGSVLLGSVTKCLLPLWSVDTVQEHLVLNPIFVQDGYRVSIGNAYDFSCKYGIHCLVG